MHENRPLDDILEVNERNGTTPPDRQRFENELEGFHSEIAKIKSQIQSLCKKCSDGNPVESEMRANREGLRTELRQLKEDGDKIKVEIESLRKAQLDLEKDCRIRNKDQLDKMLGEHERRYNTRNLSARDEQALVTEIDALKRNKLKLESLGELNAERKRNDQQLDENRKKKNKVYFELTSLQTRYKFSKQERRHMEAEIRGLKRQLYGANERRKDLINDYECNREEYKAWLNENKLNGNSVPMSFPSARKIKAPIDVEELEPYYEQKRDCNRLIHYLERLQTITDDKPTTDKPPMIDDDDDSADELPPHLLLKNPKIHVASAPSSNPTTRRNLKKGTQPISHNIDIYKLFGTVDVDVPKVYSDVANALKAVREKLEYYNQQTTNELDWGEELHGMELLSVSRTASDMDSVLDDSISDVGSISSFIRASSRTSCPSPLANDNSPRRFVAPLPPVEVKNTPV